MPYGMTWDDFNKLSPAEAEALILSGADPYDHTPQDFVDVLGFEGNWQGGAPDIMANKPGGYELWKVGDRFFLVWLAPLEEDREGNILDAIPIGFEIRRGELQHWQGSTTPTREITWRQWRQAGGIKMGVFDDIRNTEENPLAGFLDDMQEISTYYPWVFDPDIFAIYAAAAVEGRSPRETEFYDTAWWENHNFEERAWLSLFSRDPATARQYVEEQRIAVEEMFRDAGISNYDDVMVTVGGQTMSIAHYIADLWVRGSWGPNKVDDQIRILSTGNYEELDPLLLTLMQGDMAVDLDTNQGREAHVRDLFLRWLGPMLGQPGNDVVREWAEMIRESPDGEDELLAYLQEQRLSAFPAYDNPNLSYQAIAGPYLNLVQNMWGRYPNETDSWFVDMVRANDLTAAEETLRREGLAQGVEQVAEDFVGALTQSFGTGIRRAM